MVTIQETQLKEGLREAIARSKRIKRPVLVSEIHKIDKFDPLSFFYAGKEGFQGERFFWKDPNENVILVGLGKTMDIQSDQSTDRFFHVEKTWKTILEQAIIKSTNSMHGVGPTLFGGFSFDPLKDKTNLWSQYADSLFHLPKYMLSIIDGQAYLTTNIACHAHDNENIVETINEERTSLLNKNVDLTLKENFPYHIEEINPDNWKKTVKNLVTELKEGTLDKVVLARELRLYFKHHINVETVLTHLLAEQKDSFIFAFESNGDCFIGATPERLIKKEGLLLLSTCLAGSISRGNTKNEDELLGETLLSDPKNLQEHQFVVDMIKKALNDYCVELSIPSKPQLMKMRYIQHLYTPVSGVSKEDTSLFQLLEHLHPTPALGGMPKEGAIEKIREIEELDRGLYAGPIGWLDWNGNGEFAVAIRSGLIQGKEASLFAGCGVVFNSDVESEFLETRIKFRPMLHALGGTQ